MIIVAMANPLDVNVVDELQRDNEGAYSPVLATPRILERIQAGYSKARSSCYGFGYGKPNHGLPSYGRNGI